MKHICQYCNKSFTTSSNLKTHVLNAKYCIEMRNKTMCTCIYCKDHFVNDQSLSNHYSICIHKQYHDSYEEKISTLLSTINDLKSENKTLQIRLNNIQDKLLKLTERAISNPTTINNNYQTKIQQVNNFLPITEEHLLFHVNNLTLDHIMEGASGYARYAMAFPLKDRILCTDYARRKVMYKNEDGDIISDPNIVKLTKKLFTAIKDRNSLLIKEYSDRMKEELWGIPNEYGSELEGEESTNFQTRFGEVMDLLLRIMSQDRQVKELAKGERSELFHEFVKNVCSSCVSNKSRVPITNDTTNDN